MLAFNKHLGCAKSVGPQAKASCRASWAGECGKLEGAGSWRLGTGRPVRCLITAKDFRRGISQSDGLLFEGKMACGRMQARLCSLDFLYHARHLSWEVGGWMGFDLTVWDV